MLYYLQLGVRCSVHKDTHGEANHVMVAGELWGSNKLCNWYIIYREIWVVGDIFCL